MAKLVIINESVFLRGTSGKRETETNEKNCKTANPSFTARKSRRTSQADANSKAVFHFDQQFQAQDHQSQFTPLFVDIRIY